MGENFERNKKMLWNEANSVRKDESGRQERVTGTDGQLLVDESEVRERWVGYFEELLLFPRLPGRTAPFPLGRPRPIPGVPTNSLLYECCIVVV